MILYRIVRYLMIGSAFMLVVTIGLCDEASLGLGTDFSGLSLRKWWNDDGYELNLYFFGLISESVDAYGVGVKGAYLRRYTRRDSKVFPYLTLGGIFALAQVETSNIDPRWSPESELVTNWQGALVGGFRLGLGLVIRYEPVELSFELWHYNWVIVTVEGASVNAAVPEDITFSIHYFF